MNKETLKLVCINNARLNGYKKVKHVKYGVLYCLWYQWGKGRTMKPRISIKYWNLPDF